MKNINKLSRARSKGFTLVEILVATFILVMVGVAAIGVERNFIGSATTQKHRLQATGLAQEGLSAMRAAFNNHLLNPLNSTYPALVSGGTTYVLNANGVPVPGPSQTIPPPDQTGVTFTRTITVGN